MNIDQALKNIKHQDKLAANRAARAERAAGRAAAEKRWQSISATPSDLEVRKAMSTETIIYTLPDAKGNARGLNLAGMTMVQDAQGKRHILWDEAAC